MTPKEILLAALAVAAVGTTAVVLDEKGSVQTQGVVAVGDVLDDATASVTLGVPAQAGSFHASCDFKTDSTLLAGKGLSTAKGSLQGHGDFCVLGLLASGEPLAQRIPDTTVFNCVTDKIACDPAVDVAAVGWLQGNAKAGFLCACAGGPNCSWTSTDIKGQQTTGPAPQGSTLNPGTWSGADCVPKPCKTLSDEGGDTSWPGACR